jgi:hypothetical protein
MKRLASVLCAVLLCGCAQNSPPKKRPTTGPTSTRVTLSMRAPVRNDPQDSPTPVPVLIHLDIYQFDVPFGSISTNENLWKRVDEQRVGDGPATTQILFKNGLRGGTAAKSDWAFFRTYLQQLPDRTRKTTITKPRVDQMALDLDKPAVDEDLFCFDANNRLIGRSYQDSTNTLTLSFQQAPRDPASVRMVICPVVTTERHRLEFTAMNQEYESPFEEIRHLYDLNMIADVPSDDFLIVSPSPDASRSTSIGGAFLVNNEKAEKLEQILVIVPTLLRLDGTPVTLSDISLKH